MGIPGPTNCAQPLVRFQLWPLVPAGTGLQPLVRSYTGLVGYTSFFGLSPWWVISVSKETQILPLWASSVTLGHCGQNNCVPVLESSNVKPEICSVRGSLQGLGRVVIMG